MWHVRAAAVAFAVVTAGAIGAGCGSDDDGAATAQKSSTAGASASAKPAEVAYVTYTYADFQQAEEEGLKAAVEPGGGSVTVLNGNFDPQKSQQQCADAVSSGRYNVIVLSPLSPPTGVPCVTAAAAADIPVVSLETLVGDDINTVEPQVDGVVGVIAFTTESGAKALAQVVEEACAGKDPCRVIADVIPGDPFGATNLEHVSALPGVEIVQKINTMYDPGQMRKLAPDVLSRNPDADVLMVMSDQQALAAVPAVQEKGMSDQIKLIGLGGSRQGAAAVADGTLYGTLSNWPRQMGKIAGEMAVKAVNGQAIDPAGVDALQIDKPLTVTPETVDQFEPEWGAAAN